MFVVRASLSRISDGAPSHPQLYACSLRKYIGPYLATQPTLRCSAGSVSTLGQSPRCSLVPRLHRDWAHPATYAPRLTTMLPRRGCHTGWCMLGHARLERKAAPWHAATCSVQHVTAACTCSIQLDHTIYNMQHAACNRWHAPAAAHARKVLAELKQHCVVALLLVPLRRSARMKQCCRQPLLWPGCTARCTACDLCAVPCAPTQHMLMRCKTAQVVSARSSRSLSTRRA